MPSSRYPKIPPELLEEVKNGDSEAFETLWEIIKPIFLHFSNSYFFNTVDEDLISIAKTVLFLSAAEYDVTKGASFSTYYFMKLRKEFQIEMRRREKESAISTFEHSDIGKMFGKKIEFVGRYEKWEEIFDFLKKTRRIIKDALQDLEKKDTKNFRKKIDNLYKLFEGKKEKEVKDG